jgi:hypothetical protein
MATDHRFQARIAGIGSNAINVSHRLIGAIRVIARAGPHWRH